MEQIKKDLMDPEKLEATLGDESLAKSSDLKKTLEMVALFEAQMKEMNPILNYQRMWGLNLRQVKVMEDAQMTLKLPNSKVFRGLRLNWLPNALVGSIIDTVGKGIDAQFWLRILLKCLDITIDNRLMQIKYLQPVIGRERDDVAYQWGSINESNDKENNASTIHEDSIAKNVDKSMDPFEMEKLTKPELSDSEEKE
ncbi:hypothetical protein Tco_1182464 [Tanacetum coccineum]